MPFNKKIAIFDLDGTLAESKQAVSLEIARALSRLAAIGGKRVAVISGGSFAQFEKQFFPAWDTAVKEMASEMINQNLIILPTSGAECREYDPDSNAWRRMYTETFPSGVKERVLKVLNDIIASPERFGIPSDHVGEYIEDRGSQITLSALGQDAPFDRKKTWDKDQIKRQIIRKEIEKNVPEVSVGVGGSTSVDILPGGMSKAAAVSRLLERLHLTASDAVFVGDALYPGGNDSSLTDTSIETVAVSGPAETMAIIKRWTA